VSALLEVYSSPSLSHDEDPLESSKEPDCVDKNVLSAQVVAIREFQYTAYQLVRNVPKFMVLLAKAIVLEI